MRKILNILLVLFTIFLSINIVNAEIGTVDSISLDASTDTSLEISWGDVDGAFGYYVYYSEEARNIDGYSDPIVEFVEESSYVVSDLEKLTKYYVSIRVVDENATEGDFSNEVYFVTNGSSFAGSNFGLSNVKVEELDKLLLTFTSPLEDTVNAERDFKIVKKDDLLNFITTVSTEVKESNELVLNLDKELIIGGEYNLTVITIKSETGEIIESGVDGLFSFIIPESFRPVIIDPIIIKNPACYGLTLGDTTGDAPFETSVSCEGTDATTFRIECGNGKVFTKSANGDTNFMGDCNYSSAGIYEAVCYIDDTITNDSCKQSITIYSPILVDPNPIDDNGTDVNINGGDGGSLNVNDNGTDVNINGGLNVNNNGTNVSINGGNGGTNISNQNTQVSDANLNYGKGGANIGSDVFFNNTKVVASKQVKLPQTGPENIALIILSLLFGILFMVSLKSRKS